MEVFQHSHITRLAAAPRMNYIHLFSMQPRGHLLHQMTLSTRRDDARPQGGKTADGQLFVCGAADVLDEGLDDAL